MHILSSNQPMFLCIFVIFLLSNCVSNIFIVNGTYLKRRQTPPLLPGKAPDELATVVHENTHDQNHSNAVIDQANLIRQARRAIRRRVSKEPKFFKHEEPHIIQWQRKLDDLEDLESRADMLANHMKDKYPSSLAGDDALDRTNDKSYKEALRPKASPSDAAEFAGGNILEKAMRENGRRRVTEEKIKREAAKAPLNATKHKYYISAGEDVHVGLHDIPVL